MSGRPRHRGEQATGPLESNLIGRQLSHFRITAKLGAGGMGEAYLAEDTRLGRQVALKVLPEAFVEDADRVARFEREARVLASLDHPSIAAIYEFGEADGVHFLAMQLAEGETLADRIARGPVPVDEAITIGLRIAEALQAAHENGVVHRDLKPANVMVAPDLSVKVLDFGLAKAYEGKASTSGQRVTNESPTMTVNMTQAGVLMGTAAYMSPEQARGHATGPQSDVWSFGVVLREMLTGRSTFAGDTVSDTLAAVLRADIDEHELPAGLPRSLRRLLKRCFERDLSRRLHCIADARLELLAARETPTAVSDRGDAPSGRRLPLAALIVAGVVALGAGLLLGSQLFKTSAPQAPPRQFDLTLEDMHPRAREFALSHDGSVLVYAGGPGSGLFVRAFEARSSVLVPGTEGATNPFFSPDATRIGFVQDGRLKTASPSGGSVAVICRLESRLLGPGYWSEDGFIYFSRELDGYPTLSRVDARGGELDSVVPLTDEDGRRRVNFPPVRIPGRSEIVFTRLGADTTDAFGEGEIMVLEDGGAERRIASGVATAVLPTGHFAYFSDERGLSVQRFDLERLDLVGEPRVIRDVFESGGAGVNAFTVGDDGTLVYLPYYARETSVAWFDRATGRSETVAADLGEVAGARLDPTGERLAIRQVTGSDQRQIVILDLKRGVVTPADSTGVMAPTDGLAWTPDGQSIVHVKQIRDDYRVVRSRLDRNQPAVEIGDTGTVWSYATDVSPDGKWAAIARWDPETDKTWEIVLYPMDASGEPVKFASDHEQPQDAVFSPDGKWIAFSSQHTGRREIWLRGFPSGEPTVRVSKDGGRYPFWSPRATSPTVLFYGSDRQRTLRRAAFVSENPPRLADPEVVYETENRTLVYLDPNSDRLLLVQGGADRSNTLGVIVNWFTAVEELFERP